MKRLSTISLISVFAICLLPGQKVSAQDHWVASWTTAQPMIRNVPAAPRPAPAAAPQTATPQSAPPQNAAPANAGRGPGQRGFNNQTVRMIVHASVGGTKVRVKLTNPFGGTPVDVGSAHIALRSKDSDIVATSDHAITFNGKPGTTIGPGMVIVSDGVDMAVPRQGDLAVSLYFPGDTGAPSAHNGLRTSYISKEGDLTSAPSIADATPAPAYYFLESVDVLAPANASAIVTFGDSITEGARSTPDTGNT